MVGVNHLLGLILCAAVAALGAASPARAIDKDRYETPKSVASVPLDRSGKSRLGKASFYAPMFAGRIMADGTPMRPQGNNAASKTLPLGTVARVTNLKTGKSAVVRIRDRGPYVKGRIVDLSPATARQIGLARQDGITEVEVVPLILPVIGERGDWDG
jgi:rare lipoprotein A